MARWEAYYTNAAKHRQELASKLRIALRQRGWTQTKLCEATGLNLTTVYLLLASKVNSNLSTITKIETALGISLIEIPSLVEPEIPIYKLKFLEEVARED